MNDFNTANYERAVPELRIAAFGFIDSLPDFEGAQIYIAIACEKLNRVEDARAATLRVADAERIAPSYSGLALPDPIRQQFEALAQKHMTPEQVAMLRRTAAAPQPRVAPVVTSSEAAPIETATTATVATTTFAAPAPSTLTVDELPPVIASPTPVIAPAPPVAASVAPPVVVAPPAVKVEQQRLAAQQRAAAEQAETQRIAAEKAAAEHAAAERAEQDRIATARRADEERATARKAERERVAALQAERERLVAARRKETERTAAEQSERDRVAERQRAAAAQKIEEDRLAAERELRLDEERRTDARTAPVAVTAGTATVLQAEAALERGDLESARRASTALLGSQDRDTLLRVAAALYRLGDFRATVRALGKVGALRSGEEIFRYYAAVSLYETGQYAAAKKQLACALPYIQTTSDTVRYQAKIEGAIIQP